MDIAQGPEVRLGASARVEAFSDGVFAIVITILVLELRVLPHRSGDLLPALPALWAGLLAFVLSFVYVGIAWMNHHALFARVRRVDRGLQWINLGILLTTARLPFPTGVLADSLHGGNGADQRTAVALNALTAGVMSAAWLPILPYLRDHPELVAQGTSPSHVHLQRSRPWTGAILYPMAAAAGAYLPWLGLPLFVVMVVYHAITSEGLQHPPLLGRFFQERPGN